MVDMTNVNTDTDSSLEFRVSLTAMQEAPYSISDTIRTDVFVCGLRGFPRVLREIW